MLVQNALKMEIRGKTFMNPFSQTSVSVNKCQHKDKRIFYYYYLYIMKVVH